jgi:hypothetical protein
MIDVVIALAGFVVGRSLVQWLLAQYRRHRAATHASPQLLERLTRGSDGRP